MSKASARRVKVRPSKILVSFGPERDRRPANPGQDDCEKTTRECGNAPQRLQGSAVRTARRTRPIRKKTCRKSYIRTPDKLYRDVWKSRQFCNLATSSKRRLASVGEYYVSCIH